MKIKIVLIIFCLIMIIVGFKYIDIYTYPTYTTVEIHNYQPFRPEIHEEYLQTTIDQNLDMDYTNNTYDVILGDSIANYLQRDDANPKNLINTAIPGATSYDLQRELDETYFTLDTSKIARVFILIGTNDNILINKYPQYNADFTTNNINYTIQEIKKDNPDIEIYVLTPLPNRGDIQDNIDEKNYFMDDVNTSLKNNLDPRAQLLDINTIIKDEDGLIPREYTYDGLHLTHEGYVAVLDAIDQELQRVD